MVWFPERNFDQIHFNPCASTTVQLVCLFLSLEIRLFFPGISLLSPYLFATPRILAALVNDVHHVAFAMARAKHGLFETDVQSTTLKKLTGDNLEGCQKTSRIITLIYSITRSLRRPYIRSCVQYHIIDPAVPAQLFRAEAKGRERERERERSSQEKNLEVCQFKKITENN